LPVACNFIYEWAAPGFLPLTVSFGSTCFPAELIGSAILEQYFLEGDGFGGLLEEWNEPIRSVLASVQVQSAYTVPIRVNGQWWGVLCLDYCRAPVQTSAAEIAVLRTIADCIGSAIQRNRTQQEHQQATQHRVADLEAYNRMLQGRDQLLEVTARATNVLLTLDNIDVAIDSALTVLIEGVGCDRLEILENIYESSSSMPIRYLNAFHKCLNPKFEITHTDIESVQSAELSDVFRKYFLEMDGFGGLVEDWDEPLRSWLAILQIQSTYAVPIRVNGQWWGILCFDYCRAPIQFSPAEVAVLRTIADCIGSAIQRNRTQQEHQQATQQRATELEEYNQRLLKRDRLLEASAKAANVLLTVENFDEAIMTAFKVIGEGIGCDRLNILENIFQSSLTLPLRFTFIYEWSMPDFIRDHSQLESLHIEVNQLEVAFLEQYFLNGNGFGGLLEVWPKALQDSHALEQVQSAYAVPIRVNGQWWGILCLDYCRDAVQISLAETAVLKTIADCIGSAIQRNRTQQEREQAAQQRTTDLEEYNQRLIKRDQLLEVTARATNVLLTVDSIDIASNTALEILVEGTGCDRLVIMENVYESSSPMPTRYLNTIQKCLDPKFEISPTDDIKPAEAAALKDVFKKYFLEMGGFGGLLEEWDEPMKRWLATLQVQSSCSVPIQVNGQWWGILCFDYCRAPIQISPAEVAVLRTIADCIGSAIQRDRTQKLILQAEQNRVLELAKANDAMRRSIDWLAHDPDMNAFLGHLLQELAAQFDAQDAQIFLYNLPDRTLQTSIGLIGDQITFSPPYASTVNVDMWAGWEVLLQSPKPRPFSLDTESHLFLPDTLEFHRKRNNRGIVCTVLRQDEQPLGIIGFACRNRETFSESELELVQSLAQQATLAIQLTRLAEEAQQSALLQERTRMAREIHDTLAQAFGGILMQLQAFTCFAETQPDQAQTHLLTAQGLAREGLAEARRSVWTLYLETAEYENLAQAIAKFIQQAQSGQSIPIHLAIAGTPYTLNPDVGLNLLRIAQEAIANALRHADAKTIRIHLSYGAQALQLMICDDGCGFDPQSSTYGFGLLGMQQRAAQIGATWNLTSESGQGTTITIALPNGQNSNISNG
jgi:signal transduction histidine kinase